MPMPRLADIELPAFAEPTVEPSIPPETYAARLKQLLTRAAAAKLDAAIIYGDREHLGNIAWATGYDPRFEEAIAIVVPGRQPHLLVGNEGWAYAALAKGQFEPVLWQDLSLLAQPRDKMRPLEELLRAAGLRETMRIGIAGWKSYERDDVFETPHFLVEALRQFGTVVNIADHFMNPRDGLRAINDVDQLACFEFAATHTSQAIRNAISNIKPGMTEFDVVKLMQINGLPWSVHVMMSSGPRARVALPSPSSRTIEPGDPVTIAYGVHGALNCRAGFLVAGESQLPEAIRDYIQRLVTPYFVAAAAWYETIGLGVTGGEIYDAVMQKIGDPFFGVSLNPGHLIHLDEWVHSPISKGSSIALMSGMAVQCDIIPATGTDYFTSNIEDGIALADKQLRAEFEARYPQAWSRIEARRSFMRDELGINLKPEVLLFSNMPAWLPPFWLAPNKAMTFRR